MKAKKKAAIGCLAFFLLPLVFAPFCSDPTEVTSEESTEQTDLSSYIPGVEPVDVYLNLKNEGFKIDKTFNPEYGNSWECRKKIDGIDMYANIYSPNSTSKFQSVNASVMVEPGYKHIDAGKFFIKYISSLPYDGSNNVAAVNWVERHYYHSADTIIGNVQFSLKAPSKFARMLTISAQN